MLEKKSYGGSYIVPLLWVILLLGIDLGTKYLFYDLAIYKDLYLIEPAMNMGVSFSWYIPYTIVIPLSLVALGGFIYLYHQKAFSRLVTLLLVAGTLGNFFDRIWYGGVRDFLVMPDMFIFNAADVFLSIGMIIAIVSMLRSPSSQPE